MTAVDVNKEKWHPLGHAVYEIAPLPRERFRGSQYLYVKTKTFNPISGNSNP